MLRMCTLSLQARAESAHMKVQLLLKQNDTDDNGCIHTCQSAAR
jgi:hypothetical protein